MVVPAILRAMRADLHIDPCNTPSISIWARAAHPRSAPKSRRRSDDPALSSAIGPYPNEQRCVGRPAFGTAASGIDRYLRPCTERRGIQQQSRGFGSGRKLTGGDNGRAAGVRVTTLLSKHLGMSRRQSQRMVVDERVTLFGKTVVSPAFELHPSDDPNQDSVCAMKVDGKLVRDVDKTLKLLYAGQQQQQNGGNHNFSKSDSSVKKRDSETGHGEFSKTRVWLANKLKGELITEEDPVGRPSMIERLTRGGVGKNYKKNGTATHLKPVGRLDMMTEGLMIFTNDGRYARQLEMPANQLWRTYRVRVHGRLTAEKLRAMRRGPTVNVDDIDAMGSRKGRPDGEPARTEKLMKYKGVKVSVERRNLPSRGRRGGRDSGGGGRGTNTWLRVTCVEGKNRQLRRIFNALGLDATRLIRVSYGDYDLNTIPPGRALEIPCKGLEGMKKKGPLFPSGSKEKNERKEEEEEVAPDVQWINYS